MEQYLAFDVGGSYIKYGVVRADGTILSRDKTRTDSHLGAPHLLQQLYRVADETASGCPLNGIAVSTTGIIDAEQGLVLDEISSWIGGYNGTNIRDMLQQHTGLGVEIENDVNCMALGENWLGAARGYKNVVCMAIGTGIGGALLIDGELYRGSRNMAMEVGRMPIFPSYLEDLASVRALSYEYAKLANIPSQEVDGLLVAQRERERDAFAVRAFEQMCHYLAVGIASLTSALTPDVFVLGGAITADRALIDERIRRNLSEMLDRALWSSLNLQYATLGNDAGLVGAVRHYRSMRKKRACMEEEHGKAVC